jgi:ParB family chromosome partitioning protein
VARRSGLGRGLDALIPGSVQEEAPAAAPTGPGLAQLAVGDVVPNPHQPRTHFDEENLASLAASVRELGVLQPILVRPVDDRYELIAGERRWRAARRAGLTHIPAVVRTIDDAASLEQAVVENLHRQDLNPLEEAGAYQQLIEDFGLTQDEVARRVGRSRSAVANILRLFQLPPAVQRLVRDRAFQEALARRCLEKGMTVREVEEAVRVRHTPDEPAPAPPPAPGTTRPAGLLELEGLLSDRLDTRVSVSMGTKRGKVVIEFADVEDLERIYRVLTDPTLGS